MKKKNMMKGKQGGGGGMRSSSRLSYQSFIGGEDSSIDNMDFEDASVDEDGVFLLPPKNDDCQDAIPIAINQTIRGGTIQGATIDLNLTQSCGLFNVPGNESNGGVFYQVNIKDDDEIEEDTTLGVYAILYPQFPLAQITIFQQPYQATATAGGDCTMLQCVGSSIPSSSVNTNAPLTVSWGIEKNVAYYIYINNVPEIEYFTSTTDNNNNATMMGSDTFDLTLMKETSLQKIPTNDQCETATFVEVGKTKDLPGSTVYAALDVKPTCDQTLDPITPGVWYTFDLNETTATIIYAKANYNLEMSLYTTTIIAGIDNNDTNVAACNQLTCIIDDSLDGVRLARIAITTATTLTETLDAGTYYIFIHGMMFGRGTFTLDVRTGDDPVFKPRPLGSSSSSGSSGGNENGEE